jgi:hypothetical protein
MSNYYREKSFHSRKKLFTRLRYLAWLVIVGLFAMGLWLVWDVYKSNKSSEDSSVSTKPVTSTIASGTEVHTTPYFQLQTPEKWKAVANESKDGHYVYRRYNSKLVEQEFVVDVNKVGDVVLPLVQVSRVQPVALDTPSTLTVKGEVSPACKTLVPKGTERTPQIVKSLGVSFACNPDSTSYIVAIGMAGGNENLSLTRLDGTKATYRMTFSNLMAQPNVRDLDDIIETFQAR